jgi:hypothetical protein
VQNVDEAVIKAIRHAPSAYYVNVHSRPNFPGGAVRGQLGDSGDILGPVARPGPASEARARLWAGER